MQRENSVGHNRGKQYLRGMGMVISGDVDDSEQHSAKLEVFVYITIVAK